MTSLLQSRFPLALNKFRILLLDGQDNTDAPLVARLGVGPIDAAPPYVALSYTWGDPTHTQSIEIYGLGKVGIGENLGNALRRMRPPRGHGTYYWVDALCIDQESQEEKNAQIPLMRQIYRGAMKTYIWLGAPLPLDRAIATEALTLLFAIGELGSNSIVPMVPMIAMEARCETWDYIKIFFELPWFDRAWTFQEAVISREATVIYGENATTWASLLAAMKAMVHPDLHFIQTLARPGKMMAFGRAAEAYTRNPNLRLSTLMFSRRCCGATNSLDMVYAYLGLTNVSQLEIPIDYDMPVEKLYAITTKTIVGRENNLNALVAVYHPNRSSEMPSWAIDWRMPNESPPIATLLVQDVLQGGVLAPMYSAGGHEVIYDPTDDWKLLKLRGISCSRIAKVFGPCFEWDQEGLPLQCAEWFEKLHEAIGDLNSQYPDHDETYLDAFSRTIIADQDKFRSWTDHRANIEFRSTFGSIHRHPILSGSTFSAFLPDAEWHGRDPTRLNNYCLTVKRVCSNRALFLAENGSIGLAPWEIQAGDEICVLFGGEVPFILRQIGSYHELVGEAYCHGIMDGETLDRMGMSSTASPTMFTLK